MPEKRQNLARMNRARLHTLSPELTAARKKKILLSFHRNICFRRSAAREDLLAFPVPGLCMRSFACVLPGAVEPRKADTRRWLSGGSRRMKLQLCPTPEAHGASAFFRQKPPADEAAGGFVILQPRRLSFSMTAFTASMTADSKPAFLSAWTPSMVVPPGEVTLSTSAIGCSPVS